VVTSNGGDVVKRSSSGQGQVRRLGQRMVDTIGQQSWLDRPSYRLEHALTLVFDPSRRFRRLHSLNHPAFGGVCL
jgi:hypothetical protein